MAKKYEILQGASGMVSDTTVTYRPTEHIPHAMANSVTMPCIFTDEEFKEELLQSEASGFVSNEEFKSSCLEKWGVAL